MFTGLVQGVGALVERRGLSGGERYRLTHGFGRLELGESIAVNGACLTVVAEDGQTFDAELSPETLERTTLGSLAPEAPVNLERALLASDRLGGHLVSGHVDGVGHVRGLEELGDMTRVLVGVPAALTRYVAEKGSLTIDGVSLTVNGVQEDNVSLLLVPHTRQVTTLGRLAVGDAVNLEVDLIARYVERLLAFR